MADEEDEEEVQYEYTGERAEGETVELSVTVEVDEKPRTKNKAFKLLGPRAGKGKATYPSGDTYEGEYRAGLREGEGVYVYKAKGWRYAGGFKAGLRHGLGTMTYSNGERYVGYWAGGVKCGQGTMYFASKDIYTGDWKGACAPCDGHVRSNRCRAAASRIPREPLTSQCLPARRRAPRRAQTGKSTGRVCTTSTRRAASWTGHGRAASAWRAPGSTSRACATPVALRTSCHRQTASTRSRRA